MRLVVLLAGIADAKWRAGELGVVLDGAPASAGAGPARKLSPFAECAMECALKLRDTNPDIRLDVRVVGDADCVPQMRAAAAFRPDSLKGLCLPQELLWDAQATAALVAGVLAAEGPASLVLVGREFGDFDDGVFAPCLAEALGSAFVALAQEFSGIPGGFRVVRESGNVRETISCLQPLVASVTNAKSNRVRYPLMKNVMAAKRETMDVIHPAVGGLRGRRAASLAERVSKPRNAEPCKILRGAGAPQADEVARFLRQIAQPGAART